MLTGVGYHVIIQDKVHPCYNKGWASAGIRKLSRNLALESTARDSRRERKGGHNKGSYDNVEHLLRNNIWP